MQDLMGLREEPLKSRIKDLFFADFIYSGEKIDFQITKHNNLLGEINLFWAEAKCGSKEKIEESFIRLILTIGRHKGYLQPPIFWEHLMQKR